MNVPRHRPQRRGCLCGYTIVELSVTLAVVSILAATVGMFVSKLLTIQENEREEAYIREKLADICAAYADAISVGSTFGTRQVAGASGPQTVIGYRTETGGVSLETGVVTHVAWLTSSLNETNRVVEMDVYALERNGLSRRLSRRQTGDAELIPLVGDIVSCAITPLGETTSTLDEEKGILVSDAALGYLEVSAKYAARNEDRELVTNTVTAGRVVRLWNSIQK